MEFPDKDPLAQLVHLVGRAEELTAGSGTAVDDGGPDTADAAGAAGDATAAVAVAVGIERAADLHLRAAVAAARAHGVSWQLIGDALGVSRQAAFKRFGSAAAPETGGDLMTKPVVNLEERTEEVFRMLSKGDYAGVKALMTFTCARTLTQKKVMQVWDSVVQETGALESLSDTVVQTADGRNIILQQINQFLGAGLVGQTQLNHEAGEWIGRVAYNGSGKIAGLLIVHPMSAHNLPF